MARRLSVSPAPWPTWGSTQQRAGCFMYSRCLSVLGLLALSAAAATASELRVCADPNNMPFSNQQEQGFENKLAGLIAAKLGARLEYTWWSQRKSFVKNSLDEGRCDVLMGVPATLDSVTTTKPY